jgi:hypothetical protein
MSEERVVYAVREPNPTGIPARWLRFLYRMATLKGGQIYTITVIVPDKPDGEPQWAISSGAKVENMP